MSFSSSYNLKITFIIFTDSIPNSVNRFAQTVLSGSEICIHVSSCQRREQQGMSQRRPTGLIPIIDDIIENSFVCLAKIFVLHFANRDAMSDKCKAEM